MIDVSASLMWGSRGFSSTLYPQRVGSDFWFATSGVAAKTPLVQDVCTHAQYIIDIELSSSRDSGCPDHAVVAVVLKLG